MPINLLHRLVHRVQDGWDPISPEYANQYAEATRHEDCSSVIDRVQFLVGDFKGKKVLDLGGGSGQYSILMAQQGALVTWHDVSREYERIARSRAEAAGVSIQFSLGYLEDADQLGTDCFDVVFCRLCWYYCRSDRRFAGLVFKLLHPAGVGYIECNTSVFVRPRGVTKFRYALNEYFSWKVGHPLPPHGRIAKLMQRYPLERMILDYSSEATDVVMFVKLGTTNLGLSDP